MHSTQIIFLHSKRMPCLSCDSAFGVLSISLFLAGGEGEGGRSGREVNAPAIGVGAGGFS